MPRYYFNVTHEHMEVDRIGEELPDKHAAWKGSDCNGGADAAGY
jgi:hypothetical protein